jgi:hypothetical protein
MSTFVEVLGRAGVSVPDETIAEIEVPVLSGPQRQGDVGIFPRGPLSDAERDKAMIVPPEGVPVVRGEATGNTHLLQPAPGSTVWFARRESGVLLGVVEVVGGPAYLIHTDEHGANGLAAGTYVLHGKREQADVIRRVAD